MATILTAPPSPPPVVEVVSNPRIMGGEPVINGTRILAETILAYLRQGHSRAEIVADYPYMPLGGVEAVQRWAEANKLL